MQIVKESSEFHQYAFEFPFSWAIVEFCKSLKSKYGWEEFNYREGKWRFNSPEIAQEIQARFPDAVVQTEDLADVPTVPTTKPFDSVEPSKIIVTGLKLDLREYQKAGIQYLTAANGRAILADQPGVGKTAQALGFLVHNKIKRTLVVCPASAKSVWEKEVKKWTKLNSFVVDGSFKKIGLPQLMKIYQDYQVMIVNYDLLIKFYPLLMRSGFECLIGDEFHAIKNNSAQRTKAFKAIASGIPKIILLSGTPMLNRPVELFNGLNVLDPKSWPNWYKFTLRYCAGFRDRFGWNSSGASNIDELKEKIKPYFLRRTKSDVLKELPPKNFIDLPMELAPDIQTRYEAAERDLARFLRDYKKKNTDEIRRSLAAEKLVRLNSLRQITTEGKLETAIELIDQLIDNEEKVVVFSVYNAPLEALKERYGTQAVILTGKTPVKERGAMIESFQSNPKTKIFLGGTNAAGTAITLTAASNLIFVDYDYVPAIMEQAADRIHRMGQEADSVNIYQIYAKNTIDDWMVDLLRGKQRLIGQLIDGNASEEEHSIINNLFNNVEKKYE